KIRTRYFHEDYITHDKGSISPLHPPIPYFEQVLDLDGNIIRQGILWNSAEDGDEDYLLQAINCVFRGSYVPELTSLYRRAMRGIERYCEDYPDETKLKWDLFGYYL